MSAELITKAYLIGIIAVMVWCTIYYKHLNMPCYMRGVSFVFVIAASALLFSTSQLNHISESAFFRIIDFVWTIGIMYFLYKRSGSNDPNN